MTLAVIDALYVASDRGLFAAGATAHASGAAHCSVATMIASASGGRVTDLTDVPADTVAAQIEHVAATATIDGVYLGALAGHQSATSAFAFVQETKSPSVFNCSVSGRLGETVLSSRGLGVVRENLAVPDLIIVSSTDAELLSEGEITSLDDAQVAAQRLVKRGARAVVIRCGPLPARFFEIEGAERPDAIYNSDLFYDGDEFALFEAPHLVDMEAVEGASSAFSMASLMALVQGKSLHEAISDAKRYITEALRASQALGPAAPLQYFWERSTQA